MPISASRADRGGSSSQTQVNQTMTRSSNGSSGCLSGIARLLLCKGSLQTHPSDQIAEPSLTQFDLVKKEMKGETSKVQAPANPGVVARLMGLDSLPDTTNWVPKGRAPDSVTRSRSVNFMDYLLELDLRQAQHRRVRTSVSFREVPTFLNQQNHDFFVLYLDDNVEKTRKMGCKVRNSEASFGETNKQKQNEEKSKNKENIREEVIMKKEKNHGNNIKISKLKDERVTMKKEKNHGNNIKISKLKDEPRRVSHKQLSRFGSCKGAQVSSGFVSPRKKHVYRKSGETNSKPKCPVKPINQKEALVESKFMKNMKNRQHAIKEAKLQCSSSEDSSSPVSVLGLSEFSIRDQTPLSDDTRPMDLDSKKMSSPKANYFGHPPPHPTRILSACDHVEQKAMKENNHGSSENQDKEYYIELVRKLCKLTEEDIKNSNWIIAKNAFGFEHFEEISMEFGQQILDLLLYQVVEELAG